MYEVTEKILREVRKVIVGKDDVVEKVWISILAQGHVLLEDVPGAVSYTHLDCRTASSASCTRWQSMRLAIFSPPCGRPRVWAAPPSIPL